MTAIRPGHLPTWIPACLGALALSVFAALSFSTDAATRFYQWPWFFYWQVLLAVPLVMLAVRLFRTRAGTARFGDWLDTGFAVFVAANLFAALCSPFPHQSLGVAFIPIAAICLGYVLLDWMEREPGRREARIALLDLILGAGMALFVLVSLALWWFVNVLPFWSAHDTLIGALAIPNLQPLGHHVYTAGFDVLCLPWLAGLTLTARGRLRMFWATAVVLAFIDLVTTSSRAGVAAIALMLVAAGALWLRRVPGLRSRRWLLAGAVALIVGLVAIRDPRTRSLLLHGRWPRIATESNVERLAMLDAGWLMGRDRPLTGYGPGTVSLIYPRYRARLPGGTEDVLQLHDTPIQFWAELGVPGIFAALLAVVGAGILVFEVWRQYAATTAGMAVSRREPAALIALGGYAVFSLFDYQLSVPLFATTVCVLLARLAAGVPGASDRVGRRLPTGAARLVGWTLLAALVLLGGTAATISRARWLFAQAANARLRGDNAAFVAGAERAAAAAPWQPFYLTQLAAYYGEQYLQASNAVKRARARDACITQMRRALRANPAQDYCHFNLGWLLLANDPADAIRHFNAAAQLSPHRGGVYLGVGLGELALHHTAAAADALALECLNDPRTLSSPWWGTTPLRDLRSDVVAAIHRQVTRWLSDGQPTDVATRRQVRYVAALAAWWFHPSANLTDLIALGTPEQRRFFRVLPDLDRRSYQPAGVAPPARWEKLYVAWRTGDHALAPTASAPDLAAALQRRIAAESGSFTRLLTAPVDNASGLVRYYRNERLGYSVLQRNQDGFIMRDLYIFPENLLVKRYASFLFPPKGYLPGRLLLQSLARHDPPTR